MLHTQNICVLLRLLSSNLSYDVTVTVLLPSVGGEPLEGAVGGRGREAVRLGVQLEAVGAAGGGRGRRGGPRPRLGEGHGGPGQSSEADEVRHLGGDGAGVARPLLALLLLLWLRLLLLQAAGEVLEVVYGELGVAPQLGLAGHRLLVRGVHRRLGLGLRLGLRLGRSSLREGGGGGAGPHAAARGAAGAGVAQQAAAAVGLCLHQCNTSLR